MRGSSLNSIKTRLPKVVGVGGPKGAVSAMAQAQKGVKMATLTEYYVKHAALGFKPALNAAKKGFEAAGRKRTFLNKVKGYGGAIGEGFGKLKPWQQVAGVAAPSYLLGRNS
jgi:hypothetical protein